MSLIIQDISMSYEHTNVLRSVSIVIPQGEFLSILGPSGCGKTTLLKILAGFAKPTSGTVSMDGRVYSGGGILIPPEQRNMGMVFQSFALWPHMTVRQNVEFPLQSSRHRSMTKQGKKQAVAEALRITGLEALTERYPSELSGGQKQRVSLARAIVSRPTLLLMDEPLSALDSDLRVSMRKEIRNIHLLTGATVIYVTHDQGEALSLSDRIMIMRGGAVEQIGTPSEVYLHPQTSFAATFIGRCNLLRGTWEDHRFHVEGESVFYPEHSVAPIFKKAQLYPVRPEEFRLNREKEGLHGIIRSCQYNGREIHYIVEYKKQMLTVYAPAAEPFRLNEEVYLAY